MLTLLSRKIIRLRIWQAKLQFFKCTVHKIQKKELPELDDDFAKDVSEFDTLDEYKEDVRKNLTEKKEKEAKTTRENAAVDKLIEKSEMDIPKPMIDSQVSQMYEDFANRLKSQGIPIDMYLQYQGSDENKLKEQTRPHTEKRIKTRLVLEEWLRKRTSRFPRET